MDLKTWVAVSKVIGEVEQIFEAPISDIKKFVGVEDKSVEEQCSEIIQKETSLPREELREVAFQTLQKLNDDPIPMNTSDTPNFITRPPKEWERRYKYYVVELFTSRGLNGSQEDTTVAFAEETQDKEGCAMVVNDIIKIGKPPSKTNLTAVVSHEKAHCDLDHPNRTDKQRMEMPIPPNLKVKAKERFVEKLDIFAAKKASRAEYEKWIRKDYPRMSQEYIDRVIAWSTAYATYLHEMEIDTDLYAFFDLSLHGLDPSLYLCGWMFEPWKDLNKNDARRTEEEKSRLQYYPRMKERFGKLKEILPLAKLIYSLQKLLNPAIAD